MEQDGSFTVDWQRRRLLPVKQAHHFYDAALHHCVHGSRLTEWCGECVADLDVIAADMGRGAA